MRHSCRLFLLLVTLAVLLTAPAFANPQTTTIHALVGEAAADLDMAQSPWALLAKSIPVIMVVIAIGLLFLWAARASAQYDRRRAFEKQHRQYSQRMHAALALSLATDNFSDAACWEAAREEHDKILERREAIEKAEAARRLSAKERQAEYLRIAAYAAATSDLGEAELIDVLRKAGDWPYRVLREAIMQTEREVA